MSRDGLSVIKRLRQIVTKSTGIQAVDIPSKSSRSKKQASLSDKQKGKRGSDRT